MHSSVIHVVSIAVRPCACTKRAAWWQVKAAEFCPFQGSDKQPSAWSQLRKRAGVVFVTLDTWAHIRSTCRCMLPVLQKPCSEKICVDCSATSILLSYGLLVINHYFPLCENFKLATVAWYYPRLLSSPFFFFLGGGYLNLCPPSLIPLSQSMTPSKGWQNKERPLSITLGRAEMSSGLCLLKLGGGFMSGDGTQQLVCRSPENKWFATHLIFLSFYFF